VNAACNKPARKPDAGNPPVRFDEGEGSFIGPSLLYSSTSGVFPEMRTGVEYEAEVKEKQTAVGQKGRRYYDEEFKRSAVEMLESGEKSAVQLARELGVSDCSLGKWKKLYGQGSNGLEQQADKERIKALERELVRISRQRDILKKALAIIGQSPEDSVQ
jgi:transposase